MHAQQEPARILHNSLWLPTIIALRELRGGLHRFGVFLACLVLGVGMIALVGSLAAAVDEGIRLDARALLGGDLRLRQTFVAPNATVENWLAERGSLSRVATMRVMANANGSILLTELKGVDEAYPLFGTVSTSPSLPLAQALAEENGQYGAICENTLLARLNLKIGDTLRIGKATFVLKGIITQEPDRAVSVFTLGPRLMVSRQAFNATGLVLPGSLINNSLLVRLHSGLNAAAVSDELKSVFPQAPWQVRDFSRSNPRVKRFVDRMELFLTFAGLAAILVGGLGMAGAVSTYLEEKSKNIAIIKCVGGTGQLVLAAYLLQILMLATLGTAMGLALGGGLPLLLAGPLGDILALRVESGLYAAPLLKAAGFGLLTALVFSLGPLLQTRDVPAAGLFRGYVDTTRKKAGSQTRLITAAAGLLLAVYTVLAVDDTRLALYFTSACTVAFFIFRLAAKAVQLFARFLRNSSRLQGHARLRLALASLHRPGNATTQVILALGLGLTVLVAINIAGGNLLERLALSLPSKAPSFYFIDIQPHQIEGFMEQAKDFPGVESVRQSPMLRARIVQIDGDPVRLENIPPNYHWTVRSDRGITIASTPPSNAIIAKGQWWPPDYTGEPLISFAEDIAKAYGIDVGDTLTLNILGREITATIANLRDVDWASLGMNFSIIFAPGFLEGAPMSHIATVHANEDAEIPLLKKVSEMYPNVTGIRIKEVLQSVGSLLSRIGGAVNGVAASAVCAGVLVLAGVLRANTRRRFREAVILKVVGAGPGDILLVIACEYLMLGLAAGITAALLGNILAWLAVTQLLKLEWTFLPVETGVTILAAIIVTMGLGLSSIRSILREKPARILRND